MGKRAGMNMMKETAIRKVAFAFVDTGERRKNR